MKWDPKVLESNANLISDSFVSINDSLNFIHNDLSELRHEQFNEDTALDFLSSKSNISKSWNGNSSILGVIEGVFFQPDGISNNKRYYPKELWDKVLSNNIVKSSLASGMIGTYEHPSNFNHHTDDGVMTTAHPNYLGIVTKHLGYKKIDGKLVGWGKSYIMNTPVGNIINVMLKAVDEEGKPLTKLGISSRAYALPKYKPNTLSSNPVVETDSSGNTIIDPNNYILLAFDIVTRPGISTALPEYKPIYESLIDSYFTCNCEEDCKKNYIRKLGLKNI